MENIILGMHPQHRRQIDRYCDEISPDIDMVKLWPVLVSSKVFNWDDVNASEWETQLDNLDTVREILLAIKKRGPAAFKNLIYALRATNHDSAADTLEGRYQHSQNNNEAASTSNSNNNLHVKSNVLNKLLEKGSPLVINVKKSDVFLDEPGAGNMPKYRMRSKPRGCVLIITCIEYASKRKAAEYDEANLKKLFTDMGFEVQTERDLTGAQIKQKVKDFSMRKDLYKVDSAFVIISAHGIEDKKDGVSETAILAVDHDLPGAEKVYYSDILNYFTAENCEQLKERPKVFIFQSCRGQQLQSTTSPGANVDKTAPVSKLPNFSLSARTRHDGINKTATTRPYSDMLVAFATLPGYVAYRDEKVGSWYIQALCAVFMEYACDTHLVDLFSMVDSVLNNVRIPYCGRDEAQTPTVKNLGFNKHCYLNPGLYEWP